MTLDPYTAVVIASYGGPNQPDEVLPFMRNATAGKNIPDERLLEVSEHYMMFGGRSPINELNAQLRSSLEAELASRGIELPVVVGNRNWEPYVGDVVSELEQQGHHQVLGLATSAYQCYSSCRQYNEDLVRAAEGTSVQIDKIDPFWDQPAFSEANTDALVEAVTAAREESPQGRLKVLFVTHSIPLAMNAASSTGEPEKRYDAQHLVVAEGVAAAAAERLGTPLDWELTYCSRSGPPHVPWLEPDVNDRMEEIVDAVDVVVAAPIGFISDHMEVAYDLDTEAAQTAERLGLGYRRAATCGTSPVFIAMLADLLENRARVARGEVEGTSICKFSTGQCCGSGRPSTPRSH